MAYQIVNQGSVTPGRLKALLDLLGSLPGRSADRDTLAKLTQPGEESTEGTGYLLEAASELGFLIKSAKGKFTLDDSIETPLPIDRYRSMVVPKLLAELPDDLSENHELFGLYAAWAMANSGKYTSLPNDQKYSHFRRAVERPDLKGTAFNKEKYGAWKPWAVFLGLGFIFERGFMPCPVGRIWDARKALFTKKKRFQAKEFFRMLGNACPELDGGKNFNRFRSTAGLARNHVSYATSMALRLLNDENKIKLEKIADAEMWTLWEDRAHNIREFSHFIYSSEDAR